MPKQTLSTLTWSSGTNTYELTLRGQSFQQFSVEDEHSWLTWLSTHTSFLFQGRVGSLRAYQESRPRGGDYWYAYHFTHQRLRKRYLGRSSALSFSHLEEVAGILMGEDPLSARPTRLQTAVSAEKGALLPLLHSRRQVPYLPSGFVERPRLLKCLDATLTHPLTLISASAGWGKTTLLSAGQNALWMLRSPQPPPLTTVVATLLNELDGLDAPTLLLLDDYHLISEQTIHDSMLFLLEHLPTHLHLVLSSRLDPPLALSRFRVRGQLLELRDADLRFEQEETTRFLTHIMNLSLSQAEIAELVRRTGGWIAGLQLATLSLVHHPDRAAFVQSFSGNHRYVLEDVQEEILARLSPAMQHFMLHISILHRMSASVCQAVTLEPESQMMLEMIERANLFLVPLDDERRWYCFHDLFREALLARLHATQPEMIPLLHQRAASFYETQGQWREAISHRLSAADFSSAARLMEQTARQFWLRGEATTMHRWVMELPDAVMHKHARLVLTSALYLLNANYYDGGTQLIKAYKEAEQLMIRVETALRKPEADARRSMEVRLLEQRLRLLRAWSGTLEPLRRGDREQFRLIYQQMQNLEREEDAAWQMIPLSTTFTFHYVFLQEGALLVPRLLDAWQQVRQSGDYFTMLEVRRWLALAYVRAGQLHLAHQECLASLALLEQIEGHVILAGGFSLGLALVLYQWNRLEEARNALQRVIHDAVVWQHATLLSWSYRTLVKVELAAGDLVAAHQALQEAEQVAQQMGSVLQQSWVTSVRVQWWLAVGNLAEPGDWAAHVDFRQDAWEPHRYEEFLALVRVYLAQQKSAQAVEALECFSSHLDRPGNLFMTVSFLSLYVVALHQSGKAEQARIIAIRLLTLTETEGHLRVYLDAGEPMRQLLQRFLEVPADNEHQRMAAVSRSYVTALLMAFEQEQQRQEQRAETHQAMTPRTRRPQNMAQLSLIEPLSHQEQRVLQSICAGLSNREIAGELVVSVNTVKTHVKKIYSKLQVSKRIEACQVAQALRLFLGKTFSTGVPRSTR